MSIKCQIIVTEIHRKFPKFQCDVFKKHVLCDQQSKNPKLFSFLKHKTKKAANIHIGKARIRECYANMYFCLKNYLNNKSIIKIVASELSIDRLIDGLAVSAVVLIFLCVLVLAFVAF